MNMHVSRDDDGIHFSIERARDEQEMTIRVLEEKAAKYEATLRAIAATPGDETGGDAAYMRKLANDTVAPQMTLPRIFGTR